MATPATQEPRYPVEVSEGIRGQTGVNGVNLVSGALSLSEVEILDLISEGTIEGLVSGEYVFSGNSGDLGYKTGIFYPFSGTYGLTGTQFLRSVYWNQVPVINSNNKYNFQRVDCSYTVGTPNGSLVNQANPELTVSRTIGERLRGSETDSKGALIDVKDYTKYYRIFNKECKGVVVNVKVAQLFESIIKGERFGDTVDTKVNYKIFYRAIFSTLGTTSTSFTTSAEAVASDPTGFILGRDETIEGKITYGYIRSTRIDFYTDNIKNNRQFVGWEIKIQRVTPESISNNIRNQTFIDSITEIYGDTYVYPNSAIVRSRFSAEYFAQVPERAFDCKLLKVQIPSTYDPIVRTYTEGAAGWDGTFRADKFWTDNPVWCFYDLLTNQRYGLGKYIDESFIDKWTLYEISKYCDTLVPDGFGQLEPRFTCNLIINSREEAYKVINDFASIFRAITYYSAGLIYTVQDSPKIPIVQFTNANVENGDFAYSSSSRRVRHTVAIVRYNDRTNFYKPGIEYVEDIDGIRRYGIRELELTAFGCTSRGQAVRFGRWALLSETLETETISFVAGLEGAYLRPGDVFKTFDQNRKSSRFAGRTYRIDNYLTSGQITLDDKITLETGTFYNLSVLTPGYFYDTSLVSGLTSNDFSGIRNTQIQNFTFTGIQANTGVNGNGERTTINIFEPFNTGDYSFTGNLVWSVELKSGIRNQNDSFNFSDTNFDYYRAIKIEEKDDNKFAIVGLQYAEQKYVEIESGLGFDRKQQDYAIRPAAPSALTLSIYSPKNTVGTKIIDYSFVVDNYSGVTSYRVYGKQGDFTNTPGVPNEQTLIANLPVTTTHETYFPAESGTYFFRVYSVNDDVNLFSSTCASGNIEVLGINPIQDVVISSLTFDTNTGLNTAGTKQSGEYFITDPAFIWQAGINEDASIPSNFKYRVSFRSPSSSNTPTSTIYFQETGLEPDPSELKYIFTFDNNMTIAGGPMRRYDVVVEAVNASGATSAGNFLSSPLAETWSNPYGYDIFEVNNAKVTGIQLSSGTNNLGGFTTSQFIDAHGAINIHFKAGNIPTDVVGGYLFASTGIFSGQNITGQIPTQVNITTGKFIYDFDSKYIDIPMGLTNVKTGYCMVGFYDKFDDGIIKNYPNLYTGVITGLPLSRLVPVLPSGSLMQLDITKEMTIFDEDYPADYGRYRVRRETEDGITYVQPVMIDKKGNASIIGSVREP